MLVIQATHSADTLQWRSLCAEEGLKPRRQLGMGQYL
jgi:hypothetical protein